MAHDETKMAEAYRWLDKAIRYEEEGKSEKIIAMSLEKAVKLEREALGLST